MRKLFIMIIPRKTADHTDLGNCDRFFEMRMNAAQTLFASPKIAVWMLKGNERAIRFYEKYGLRFNGTEQEIMLAPRIQNCE